VEALRQPAIRLVHRGGIQPPGFGAARESRGLPAQASTLAQERQLHEAAIAVIPGLVSSGLFGKPVPHLSHHVGQTAALRGQTIRRPRRRRLEFGERACGPSAHGREKPLDGRRDLSDRVQCFGIVPCRRMWRIVDEQDDRPSRVILERRRQHGFPHNARVFLV